jgi:alpha-amylase
VRQKIAGYLNNLIDNGVAGLRMDAAKHMYPADIAAILGMVKNNARGGRPFNVQEVIDQGGEPIKCDQYLDNGRVTNFKYGLYVAAAVKKNGQNFKYFGTFGQSWGMWADNDVLNFIDNHDNQRGSGGGGSILTYKDGDGYIMGVTFMLAYPYGYPRVMSSYYFSYSDQGPPGGSPSFNGDNTCNAQSGWVCEHRWPAIRNMVEFRSHVGTAAMLDVVTDEHRIAFRRGNAGFFGLNNQGGAWSQRFQTGLPAGTYCDLISGGPENGRCKGAWTTVDGSGFAQISIGAGKTFAIDRFSTPGGGGGPTQAPVTQGTTAGPLVGGTQTVVFMKKDTLPGQDLFVRGGIDHSRRQGCTQDANTSPCAIPIRHNTIVPANFTTYIDWSVGDYHLDWYGAEVGQGAYLGQAAAGTPLAWSTNKVGALGYQELNKYGDGYWFLNVTMDCSKTLNGWFELKGYLKGGEGFETDRAQTACGGSAGGTVPFSTTNHAGRCGFINVFEYGANGCNIDKF